MPQAGTADTPIVWATHPEDVKRGLHAVLSGGVAVPPSAFVAVQVPTGVPDVFKAELSALGVNSSVLGKLSCPYPTVKENGKVVSAKLEAFIDGEPMTLARDPNIGDDPLATWKWVGYENATAVDELRLDLADGPTAKRWAAAMAGGAKLWLHAYTKFDWRDAYLRLASITPNKTATNRTSYTLSRDPSTTPQYPWVNGCRFYALDNLALLDQPGEYFVSDGGSLYLRAPTSSRRGGDDGGGPSGVVVSALDTVVHAIGANHSTWANLTIEAARGDAFILQGSHVALRNVTVRNAGGDCISVSGSNVTVEDSRVYGCGRAGVGVAGGDTIQLTPSGNRVVGNVITNFSRIVRTYMPAVAFSGVGHYVANNTMSNGPHCGVQGNGNDNLFEFNYISHCSYECTDTGAFYVGRSWAQRGNVARFNHFDTIRPTEKLAQKSCSQNAYAREASNPGQHACSRRAAFCVLRAAASISTTR